MTAVGGCMLKRCYTLTHLLLWWWQWCGVFLCVSFTLHRVITQPCTARTLCPPFHLAPCSCEQDGLHSTARISPPAVVLVGQRHLQAHTHTHTKCVVCTSHHITTQHNTATCVYTRPSAANP